MFRKIDRWILLLAGVLALRLISMAVVPFADTSEPRYAEIARVMAVSGDWITPWFEPSVPFWGKPPLAFWAQALSIQLFGPSEFAARLPAWLVVLGMLALVHALGARLFGRRAARWAVLACATSLLMYVVAGAVLVDGFLALGTLLTMVSFILAPRSRSLVWKYGVFVGLAIGLLAKGPLALVLVGGAIVPWLLWQGGGWREYVKPLPWVGGLCLVAVLVVPWYVAAEIKTPGFLRYFIVGEHFLRFLDSGWTGDRYGHAHMRAYGSIWIDWILSTLPWSVVALAALAHKFARRGGWGRLRGATQSPEVRYLLCWTLFTPLFFTMAGNIIWTYVLPALPAFALLVGKYLDGLQSESEAERAGPASRWMLGAGVAATFMVPLFALGFAINVVLHPERLETDKRLVEVASSVAPDDSGLAKTALDAASPPRLVFVDRRSFSARFYSRERAELIRMADLPALLTQAEEGVQVAIPRGEVDQLPAPVKRRLVERFASRNFVLFSVRKAMVAASAPASS